ncbi:glycosyltransferase [bacterium]|nr:glycosyltransferase [bacterium]
MKISFAIPVCNEIQEIQRLLDFLVQHKRKQDEIVVVIDEDNGTEEVKDRVKYYCDLDPTLKVAYHALNKDFATHKNFINSQCSGDYIFSIDADEMPDETLIRYLPEILESNDVDAIWIPRINIVNGITPEHIARWRWTVNEDGWVNWPNDPQLRVYKNKPEIVWKGKVHERITGFKTISRLPDQKEFALWHVKEIDRQEKQNKFYSEI